MTKVIIVYLVLSETEGRLCYTASVSVAVSVSVCFGKCSDEDYGNEGLGAKHETCSPEADVSAGPSQL